MTNKKSVLSHTEKISNLIFYLSVVAYILYYPDYCQTLLTFPPFQLARCYYWMQKVAQQPKPLAEIVVNCFAPVNVHCHLSHYWEWLRAHLSSDSPAVVRSCWSAHWIPYRSRPRDWFHRTCPNTAWDSRATCWHSTSSSARCRRVGAVDLQKRCKLKILLTFSLELDLTWLIPYRAVDARWGVGDFEWENLSVLFCFCCRLQDN